MTGDSERERYDVLGDAILPLGLAGADRVERRLCGRYRVAQARRFRELAIEAACCISGGVGIFHALLHFEARAVNGTQLCVPGNGL